MNIDRLKKMIMNPQCTAQTPSASILVVESRCACQQQFDNLSISQR